MLSIACGQMRVQELIRTTLESINQEIANIKQSYSKLQIDADIIEGDPATVIIKTAENKNYDVIIMGKRGISVIKE